MFSLINPLQVLSSPLKSGVRLVLWALLFLLPYLVFIVFQSWAKSRAVKSSNKESVKDQAKIDASAQDAEQKWNKDGKIVDKERES